MLCRVSVCDSQAWGVRSQPGLFPPHASLSGAECKSSFYRAFIVKYETQSDNVSARKYLHSRSPGPEGPHGHSPGTSPTLSLPLKLTIILPLMEITFLLSFNDKRCGCVLLALIFILTRARSRCSLVAGLLYLAAAHSLSFLPSYAPYK